MPLIGPAIGTYRVGYARSHNRHCLKTQHTIFFISQKFTIMRPLTEEPNAWFGRLPSTLVSSIC